VGSRSWAGPPIKCPAHVSSQQEAQKLLDNLSETRLRELFKAYGVNLVAANPGQVNGKTLDYCAIIGFSGEDIRGSLAVAGSSTLLAASNPMPGGPPRDWVAELANQLMGHVKSGLRGHSVQVYISMPIVLHGQRLALEVRGSAKPQIFTSHDGVGYLDLALWVEVETTPDFRMTSEENPALSGVGGGQSLIF
jgi:CheY-specific phosphatase CheX